MPNYDYRCLTCGHEYELFQSISEKPATKCPKCGKKVQRLIGGGSGVSFKGTGFYETDYKKSSGSCSSDSKPAGGCGKTGGN
jgi:putative FmdB family regulatory protein